MEYFSKPKHDLMTFLGLWHPEFSIGVSVPLNIVAPDKSCVSFSCTNQSIASRTHTCLLSHLSTFHFCSFVFMALCVVPFFYAWCHWPVLTSRDFPTGHLLIWCSCWVNGSQLFKSTLRCVLPSQNSLLPTLNWVFRHHYNSSHRTLLYCAGCLVFAHFWSMVTFPSSYVSGRLIFKAILQ